MRARPTSAVLAFVIVFFSCSCVTNAEAVTNFAADIAHYFMVTDDAVEQVVTTGVSQNDIPVVFFFAEKSGASAVEMAELRSHGNGWPDIAQVLGIGPRDFYVIVVGDLTSDTFAPIFEKYESTPVRHWSQIDLTDSDIINLVNLRFVGSEHDYSSYEIMALRDSGKTFAAINQEIRQRKDALVRIDKDRHLLDIRADNPE